MFEFYLFLKKLHFIKILPLYIGMQDFNENAQKKKIVWFMVFNATLNNISVILWWSVLLVEETGVPGENHRPVPSQAQK